MRAVPFVYALIWAIILGLNIHDKDWSEATACALICYIYLFGQAGAYKEKDK